MEGLEGLTEALAAAVEPDRFAAASSLAIAMYRRLPIAQRAALDVSLAVARVDRALAAFEAGATAVPSIVVDTPVDEEGRASTHVHVHAVDGPFVVSTVTGELERLGLDAIDVAHPVVGVERAEDGDLLRLTSARGADHRETYLLFDLGTVLDEGQAEKVAAHLERVVGDAMHVVDDFRAMRSRVHTMIGEATEGPVLQVGAVDSPSEVADFLRWLLDDHFVFLAAQAYDVADGTLVPVAGSGLGVLRDHAPTGIDDSLAATLTAEEVDGATMLRVSRTAEVSSVHRQVRMMDVGMTVVSDDGTPVAYHRLLGLLAQKAYVEPSSTVPVLRRKLAKILETEDVVDHSQDERALRTLFDAYPKQELFETPLLDLRDALVGLLDVGRRDGVRLMLRTERSGHSVSALVTVPRDRFSADLRREIQSLLATRIGASAVDYKLSMTERDQPLLHFTLRLADPGSPVQLDTDSLQQEIARLTRTFEDALAEALAGSRGPADATLVASQWCAVLPVGYVESTPVAIAVADLEELEALAGGDGVRMRVLRMPRSRGGEAQGDADLLRFRLYKRGPSVELSGFIPVLESLGLTVVQERPHVLRDTPVGDEVHLHDYGVRWDGLDGIDTSAPDTSAPDTSAPDTGGLATRVTIDVRDDGPRMAAAAMAMWLGKVEVDSLNRLVLAADIDVHRVAILRAYRRYLRQIGTTYTEATTNDALLEHPVVARRLLELFDARLDPAKGDGRDAAITVARDAVLDGLDEVDRLDQDRILRSFLGMIDATLRTNRWRRRPWLSLKLESARVPGVPKPVPYREIFVYSPASEGIHLRGGPVARGGLRWSDRLDDFRTEVLGLMKAQMSKNAVIVPSGSKGGFVLKRRPTDPQALRDEVHAQYEVFIRGLLDVTDTIVDGDVVGPPDVVRTDGDDPYLVVAADRGTATFSDTANAISAEYGFWLGDAFASGGSQGYDHKAMGITARGAWVAVQRHFIELGVDVQSEAFTVAGVGDMSGDVFGNGMLRSETTRLVAAFDHRDIFLDPDPDPAVAYAERQRLYDTPRSSWQDYGRDLISEGGGVWSRGAKSIVLTPQVKDLLRVEADQLSPPELISAILSAPVDLLWFGGIGTYVKAADEAHGDVGDRSNDAIRVDADQVGARVVGEGGNLAMTQRGRIAYGRRGGRCNTDAIDNVAGVNTSDREVNLKILLRLAIEQDRLDAADRNALLAEQTEDIATLVLADSYAQTWAVSQEVMAAPGGMGSYERFMADLEGRGRLDRDVEVLPDTAEVEHRRTAGAGLTRAEVSVLLAYAKIDLTEALLASGVPDQPALAQARRDYFPPAIAERFGDLADQHRLHRELVATILANDVVNRLGITWVQRTAESMGVTSATVVAAYQIATEVMGAHQMWGSIEAVDGRTDPTLQMEMKQAVSWLVDALTRSYVRLARTDDIAGAVADDRAAFAELYDLTRSRPSVERPPIVRQAETRWLDLGVDEDLVNRIAVLPTLTLVPGTAITARTSGRSVADAGQVYELIGERLPLDEVNSWLRSFDPHGRWQRSQHRGLLDDVRRLHHGLSRNAIAGTAAELSPPEIVDRYLAGHADAVDRAATLAEQLRSSGTADLDALAVVVRALSEVGT